MRSAATAGATALLVAGCGGGIDHRQYVQRADAICAFTLRSVRSLTPPQLSGATSAHDASLAVYLGQLVPLLRRELRQLRALPRPSERAAQTRALDGYLASLNRSVSRFASVEQAARSGDGDGDVVNLLESELAADPAPRLAFAYGLTGCSSSAPTYG
jgi:hypothetical protein